MIRNILMPLLIIVLSMVTATPVTGQRSTSKEINKNLVDLGDISPGNQEFMEFDQLKPILKDVEIVMLGEQSHQEGTVFDTKVKLVKYLHQEMGFDLLVIESGFYDCSKAWGEILQGESAETGFAKSIFSHWSTSMSFKPLASYVDSLKNTPNQLTVLGFDNQFSGTISQMYYLTDLRNFLSEYDPNLLNSPGWFQFQMDIATILEVDDLKKVKKENVIKDTIFINELVNGMVETDSLTLYWKQSLKNCKALMSDWVLGTDLRDRQMAENLVWIKENNPGKKIVCWGATSHFLYNQEKIHLKKFPYNVVDNYYQKARMMGDYIKNEFGDKVYTVGFIAYEGKVGFYSRKKIKPATKIV